MKKLIIRWTGWLAVLLLAPSLSAQTAPGTASSQSLPEITTSEDKADLAALEMADQADDGYVSFLGILDLPKATIDETFMITAGVSRFQSADFGGNEKWYTMPMMHLGLQFFDNMWLEGSYGEKKLRAFPSPDIDTKLRTIIIKAKYTFGLPSDFYVQIYGGHLHARADSPNAGVGPGAPAELAEETDIISRMKEDKFIYGLTLMKEFPYNIMLKGDLGRDVRAVSVGLLF